MSPKQKVFEIHRLLFCLQSLSCSEDPEKKLSCLACSDVSGFRFLQVRTIAFRHAASTAPDRSGYGWSLMETDMLEHWPWLIRKFQLVELAMLSRCRLRLMRSVGDYSFLRAAEVHTLKDTSM